MKSDLGKAFETIFDNIPIISKPLVISNQWLATVAFLLIDIFLIRLLTFGWGLGAEYIRDNFSNPGKEMIRRAAIEEQKTAGVKCAVVVVDGDRGRVTERKQVPYAEFTEFFDLVD